MFTWIVNKCTSYRFFGSKRTAIKFAGAEVLLSCTVSSLLASATLSSVVALAVLGTYDKFGNQNCTLIQNGTIYGITLAFCGGTFLNLTAFTVAVLKAYVDVNLVSAISVTQEVDYADNPVFTYESI